MAWTGRIVLPSGFQAMPWKNGMGMTWEIAKTPEWRLSLAAIETDAPFSRFEGQDRFLVVIEGAGIELGFAPPVRLHHYEALRFPGETPVTCHLIDGPTRDLNLMVDRARASFSASLVKGVDVAMAAPDARFFLAMALAGSARLEMAGYPPVELEEGSAFIAERWVGEEGERPALHVGEGNVAFQASIVPL